MSLEQNAFPERPAQAVDEPPPTLVEQAAQIAANAMFIAGRDGRIQWINAAFTRLFGYAPADVLGRTPRVLKSGRQSAAFYRELWSTISAGRVWRGHLCNRRKTGELFDVEQTVTPVRDARGEVSHYFVIYEDITERLRSEQHLAQLAMFDSLTGLPNRTQFQARLDEAFARARRSGKPLAVMLLDLDHFKNVNDTLGHAGGDELLRIVARCMGSTMRDTDMVARLSGDEFAVLIEDLRRPDQAIDSAQRLIDVLSSPLKVLGATVQIGASVGIAVSGDPEDTPERLMHNADLAMYQAKSRGRSRFQFFDAAMDQAARRRHDTHAALRRALREDRFSLAYQPQVNMRTGQVVGVEALLRWDDPLRGAIPAADFIAVAEQDEMIFALNDWVLRTGFAQIAALHACVPDMVPVSVNVSAGQFDRVDLAPSIESLLRQHALPGSALRLEITETVMLRSSLTVHENLRALSRLGVKMSIDDFGTGYSSLPTLRDFPVSSIKLDMGYVRGIGKSTRDEKLLAAIIGLATKLDLDLIAEGVETQEQRAFLLREGCEIAQGHLYRPAMPIDEFTRWMLSDASVVRQQAQRS